MEIFKKYVMLGSGSLLLLLTFVLIYSHTVDIKYILKGNFRHISDIFLIIFLLIASLFLIKKGYDNSKNTTPEP